MSLDMLDAEEQFLNASSERPAILGAAMLRLQSSRSRCHRLHVILS